LRFHFQTHYIQQQQTSVVCHQKLGKNKRFPIREEEMVNLSASSGLQDGGWPLDLTMSKDNSGVAWNHICFNILRFDNEHTNAIVDLSTKAEEAGSVV
ncbi:hypothetical protein LINPERPRIM_LOCUS32255, partial [Linum perenne]